jgi:hypothetical protein
MSGQRSADSEGTAESVAAGCSLRELPRIKRELRPDLDGPLAVFTWGRGEDGQLGLGDTSDQDQPTYGTYRCLHTELQSPSWMCHSICYLISLKFEVPYEWSSDAVDSIVRQEKTLGCACVLSKS